MYICNDCKSVFTEYGIRTERELHSEFLPDVVWEDLHFPICPECGSEDFEEACECLYCGENKARDDMLTDEICRKCFTELSEQRKDLVNGFLTENAEYFAEFCAEKLKEETS